MAREMMECPGKDVVSAGRSRCGDCNQGSSGQYPLFVGCRDADIAQVEEPFLIRSLDDIVDERQVEIQPQSQIL